MVESTAVIATACCGGQRCCSLWCCGCASLGVPAKTFPKVAYIVQASFFMGISVILLYLLQSSAQKWEWF
jgi:hypothetical protein